MGRSPSFEKGLKKGPWTSEEDRKLVAYIEQHGQGSWRALPLKAGLKRCGKSCRLRWTNYLRPDIKRGKFSLQEEQTIIQLHALLGNRWSSIATHLSKRTDNEIKNYWNTHLKKQLTKMGIDPVTHKSRTAANTNLSHMTQWENARLEAEARLVRGSRVRYRSAPFINKPLVSSLSRPQPLCLDVLKAWPGLTLSKLSNLTGLETPIALTGNIGENVEPQTLKDMQLEDHLDHSKLDSNGSFNDLEIRKDEETRYTFEMSDMIYQDIYLADAFTNHLVKDDDNENDDNGCWSTILDNLDSDSSFPSIF